MVGRYQINKSSSDLPVYGISLSKGKLPNTVKKGSFWSCFGNITVKCRDSNGAMHKIKIQKNSLINLIRIEAQKKGERVGPIILKKSVFLGLGGSSNKKVQDAFYQLFTKQPTPNSGPSIKPPIIQTSQKPLNTEELLSHVHPKAGKISEGGKEIQKIIPFSQWLDNEYPNKQSPTYKAYQSLSQSLELNNAYLVGIRGDGNCGFRAMIASLLLQLAADPQCQNKCNTLTKILDRLINDTKDSIPGFDKLNQKCLQDLKNCNGNPAKLADLLNQDDFMNQLTSVFRFLSNAICIHHKDRLPVEVLIQLEHGEGAQELGGLEPFLKRHATVDVENTQNVPGYLFAGVAQILVLARELGLGYHISIVDEGQLKPQEPNTSIPDNALLVLNLLCRDTRHFDVILQKR